MGGCKVVRLPSLRVALIEYGEAALIEYATLRTEMQPWSYSISLPRDQSDCQVLENPQIKHLGQIAKGSDQRT